MKCNPDVLIALYGSTVRGDFDAFSDIDVLVLADRFTDVEAQAVPPGATPSWYTWDEWSSMRSKGSIFLSHIAAESKVITHRGQGYSRFSESLKDLPLYAYSERDFDAFEQSLLDISEELKADDCCLHFELSTLAMTVRHISILVCYLVGFANFSRTSSVAIATSTTGVAKQLADDFEWLYKFKLHAQGRCHVPPAEPTPEVVRNWIFDAQSLILHGRNLLKEF